jgi:exodeoxyribonuclease-1
MKETFFWYDYETFGLNPKSDRPAQFAGIRTTMDLEEIGEPINIHCKPSQDAIPSPISCLITGITPQYCDEKGISEHEFSSIIFRELNTPHTVSVGYNNIKFDDEFNRFLFWRNLSESYIHTWKNGCSRWDLTKVVQTLYAFRPHAIVWPVNDHGVVSMKLEDLCRANHISHESAHDALSDVRATIALARLIKQVEPRLFDYCFKLRHKDFVLSQFSSINHKKPELLAIDKRSPMLHVSSMFGVARGFLATIYPLAIHPTNTNEIIVWDLQSDPSILGDLSADEIRVRMFTRSEDLPNGIKRLPIKTIAINQSPVVISDRRVLTPELVLEWDIDLEQIEKHTQQARALQLAPSLWQEVYHRTYESLDVDEGLYQGFVNDEDRALLERARRLHGRDLSENEWSFTDTRLNELVFRYRARNFPEHLTLDELKKWKGICSDKISKKISIFNDELEELRSRASHDENRILDQAELWVRGLCESVGVAQTLSEHSTMGCFGGGGV